MGYDYRAVVKRADGATKTTGIHPTPGLARAEAKRFLRGKGGSWDMSNRIGPGYANSGMLTGGESAKMDANGSVRY
jgi:hypothetical protein